MVKKIRTESKNLFTTNPSRVQILFSVVLQIIVVKLISFGLDWYESYLNPQKRNVIDPALVMLNNAGKLLAYVTGASIALSHFL